VTRQNRKASDIFPKLIFISENFQRLRFKHQSQIYIVPLKESQGMISKKKAFFFSFYLPKYFNCLKKNFI